MFNNRKPVALLLAIAICAPWNPAVADGGEANEIAARAAQALRGATVRYRVEADRSLGDRASYRGLTTVVLAHEPLRLRVEHRDDAGQLLAIAVAENNRTTTLNESGASQSPTLGGPDAAMMVVTSEATAVVAATRAYMHDSLYREAIAVGAVMVAGQDDVDGDLCDVVLLGQASVGAYDHVATYISISRETGLPRRVQSVRRVRGQTRLDRPFTLLDIEVDPLIPADAFELDADALEFAAGPAREAAEEPRAPIVGRPWPDIELGTVADEPWRLAGHLATPALVTFWAPWCGWCIEEFPHLMALRTEFDGRLQVFAIGVQDSRLAIKNFIDEHAQYDLTFLLDPDLQQGRSRLSEALEIRALPVSVIVDAEGRICDRWIGCLGVEALRDRVAAALSREKP